MPEDTTDATTGDTRTDRAADHTFRRPMKPQSRADDGQRDERAVSEVIGAILMFGLVLAVLALIQVSAVPAANSQIEYEHSQRVEGDFQRLDNAIDGAAFDGSRSTTPLEVGTRYPVRLFLLNPGPVSGDIRTGSTRVQLSGFGATNEETRDYLQGDLSFATRNLSYRANYNEYRSAPRVGYEGGILYERYAADAGGRDVVANRGALVSGRRITLVTLDGDLSTAQVDALSLDAVPVSTSIRPVSVDAPSGTAPTVTIETSLSEETWRNEILDTEFDPNGSAPNRYVSTIACTSGAAADAPCNGELELNFEPGRTYDLRMAKVGLGSGFGEEPAHYLTTVEGDDSNILDTGTQRLTVEARDQYNNPVSGVGVPFSTDDGEFQRTGPDGTVATTTNGSFTATTDADGRVTAVFVPDGPGDADIDASTNLDGANGVENRERVTFDVSVTDADGGGGDGDGPETINRGDRGLYYTGATVSSGSDKSRFSVDFESLDGEEYTIEQARISFVASEGDVTRVDDVYWTTSDGVVDASEDIIQNDGRLRIAGDFRPLSPDVVVQGSTTETLVFDFDANFQGGQSRQEFFVLNLVVEGPNGEQFQTFFIGQTS